MLRKKYFFSWNKASFKETVKLMLGSWIGIICTFDFDLSFLKHSCLRKRKLHGALDLQQGHTEFNPWVLTVCFVWDLLSNLTMNFKFQSCSSNRLLLMSLLCLIRIFALCFTGSCDWYRWWGRQHLHHNCWSENLPFPGWAERRGPFIMRDPSNNNPLQLIG